MPYYVGHRGSQYCVIDETKNSPVPGGCHPTKEDATAHMRAIYANEKVKALAKRVKKLCQQSLKR